MNLRRDRCACFRRFSTSLFHHLLLNGHILANGVVSAIARLIASLISFANLSISFIVDFV